MIDDLRLQTQSNAKIIIDDDTGTRLGILKLVDSCNAYVSTDTALTATVSEALVRQRLLIVPDTFLLNPDNGYIQIPTDSYKSVPITKEMLLYQPNHKGATIPILNHQDVRLALRQAYTMSIEERRAMVANMAMVPGPSQTVPPMIKAIKDGWALKTSEARIELQSNTPCGVVWEGPQFSYHSLALINRELSIRLMDAGHELSIINTAKELAGYKIEDRFQRLTSRVNQPLKSQACCHIRHQWPPDFTPPDQGHWIMIQPWEYGSLPKAMGCTNEFCFG